MSLVLFGDYVSYYLAMLYEIDPTSVKAIDYLKQQLTQIETNVYWVDNDSSRR